MESKDPIPELTKREVRLLEAAKRIGNVVRNDRKPEAFNRLVELGFLFLEPEPRRGGVVHAHLTREGADLLRLMTYGPPEEVPPKPKPTIMGAEVKPL